MQDIRKYQSKHQFFQFLCKNDVLFFTVYDVKRHWSGPCATPNTHYLKNGHINKTLENCNLHNYGLEKSISGGYWTNVKVLPHFTNWAHEVSQQEYICKFVVFHHQSLFIQGTNDWAFSSFFFLEFTIYRQQGYIQHITTVIIIQW